MATTSTRISRHLNAPRANVYRALIDADAVARWMVPSGMTSHVHVFDAREGGSFRISLTYDAPTATGKTTANTDTYHGRFVKLVPNEQVVEMMEFETTDSAMRGEMTVTYTLNDADGGTDLHAVHDNLPPGISPADNATGWQMALDKLAALVEASMWEELSAYEGKDLQQLDDAGFDDLLDLLEKLFPEYRQSSSISDPYYIWKVHVLKHTLRYVVVDGQQLQRIPGASKACISLFDEAGKLVGASEFSTGWRIDIKGIAKMQNSIIGVPIVVILTRRFSGRDIARQYYALYDDNVVLVRLEDSNGSATRNRYTTSNQVIGPIVAQRSRFEWQAMLDSPNEVEVLLALMWISGIHDDSTAPGSFAVRPGCGESEHLEEIQKLRGLELVQERLSWLMKSDNQWIREAAEIAVNSKV